MDETIDDLERSNQMENSTSGQCKNSPFLPLRFSTKSLVYSFAYTSAY